MTRSESSPSTTNDTKFSYSVSSMIFIADSPHGCFLGEVKRRRCRPHLHPNTAQMPYKTIAHRHHANAATHSHLDCRATISLGPAEAGEFDIPSPAADVS